MNLRHFFFISCYILCLPPTTSSEYERRIDDLGYSHVPYETSGDEDEKQEEGRMSSRGYNSNPFEVNVVDDNLFSRENDCSPGLDGLFGADQGVEQELGFFYQIETIPILERSDEARDEILESVETSVSRTLLPSLFLEDCAMTERSRQRARTPHRHLEEMLGISTLPKDTILEGGTPFRSV